MISRSVAFSILVSAGFLSVSACANGPKLPGFGGQSKAEIAREEDKVGRVTMVLTQETLTPNADLAGTAVTLPAATPVPAWREAGARANKVVGHVDAAPKLTIAWRRSVGKGSTRKAALTTPPVTSETLLYMLDAAQEVHALQLDTGAKVWSEKLSGTSKRDRSALGGGLAVSGDTLVVASGYGFVIAMDAATGAQRWRRELGGPVTGAPTIDDGRVFVSSNNNEIYALELATGEVIWSDQAIAESARVLGSSSPAAVEDFIIAPFSSGEVIAYYAANGRRLWVDAISQAGRFTPISEINDIGSRPVLGSGLVFASSQSGATVAIDGRTGTRIWTQPVGSTNAPALSGAYLFVIGINGELACLDAGTGNAYWVAQLPQFRKEKDKKDRISYSGPILASGRVLVVSSRGELLAFSPETGQQTGSLKLGSTAYLEPIAAQGRLYVLTDDGKIVAID